MSRKVLVVEDDPAILEGVSLLLEDEGYSVLTARDGDTGYRLARDEDPDVVILDVMLPRRSGMDVCKKLHEDRIRGAVLLLTARATDRDKVKGLEAGADDYMTKPFNVDELVLRVKALMRRTPEAEDLLQRFEFGRVKLDFASFEATRDGARLDLTPRELRILRLLCEQPGRVVSRNELLDKVWGYDVFPTTRTVDNHIVKLRKAIEDDPARPKYIVSVRGVGYKLDPAGAGGGDEGEP